jgi:hypothetical protein
VISDSAWQPEMFSRVKKLALLGPAKQLLLLRIWLMLARARFTLLRKGLAHFTSGLTLHLTIPVTQSIPRDELEQARELGRLVAIAARYTPWQSRCLTQVLVLHQLLEQRKIPGYFSLGVRKAGDDEADVLNAHAWLQCGNAIVNGELWGDGYIALSSFSWGLRTTASSAPDTAAGNHRQK